MRLPFKQLFREQTLMQIFEPRMRYVTAVVLTVIIGGVSIAWSKLNLEFMFYAATVGLQILLFLYIDRRVKFSPLVLWGLTLWALLHFAGGLMPIPESITEVGRPANLYNMRLAPWFPKYDQLVHAYGFGMTAILIYEAICVRIGRALRIDLVLGSVLFLTAMGLGAMNEVIEFLAVLLMPDTNVGGYENTGWDLVSNGTGALIAIYWLKLFRPVRD